jgi:L-asparaginase
VKPNLLFLLTGGTLLMTPREAEDGARLSLDPGAQARDLVDEVPALGRLADIEIRAVCNMDSADMQPSNWLQIARAVHGALSSGEHQGVVVIHGTDTMAYSASALALLLGPVPRPVVLTGAQRPLAEARTDARDNLINAALVASLPVPEVSIAFASRALRGVRATKRDAWALSAFESPNCDALVELGLEAIVAPHVRPAGQLAPIDDRLEPRVLAVRLFPGLDPALLRGAIRAGVKGLVLEAYGSGSFPSHEGSLVPVLEEARAHAVPVLVVSQCFRGFVDLGRYEAGALALSAGAIDGGDMTAEAALAKMMVGLGRFGAGPALRAYLEADAVGERTAR